MTFDATSYNVMQHLLYDLVPWPILEEFQTALRRPRCEGAPPRHLPRTQKGHVQSPVKRAVNGQHWLPAMCVNEPSHDPRPRLRAASQPWTLPS